MRPDESTSAQVNAGARPVAVVTGAARGGGRGAALALAAAGHDLVIVARSTREHPSRLLPGTLEETAETAEALGATVECCPADLAEPSECDRVVASTLQRFSRCDVLVNNAAYNPIRPFTEMSTRTWRVAMAVNVDAAAALTLGFLPTMLANAHGRVINIGSAAAVQEFGLPQTPYATAKAALERFTAALAVELWGTGVSVNCIRVDELLRSEAAAMMLTTTDDTGYSPEEFGGAVVWAARQPATVTGQFLTFAALRTLGGLGPAREHRDTDHV